MSNIIKLKSDSKKLKVKIQESSVKSIHEEQELAKERERLKMENVLTQKYEQGYQDGQDAIRNEMEEKYNSQLLSRYDEIAKTFQSIEEEMKEYKDIFSNLVTDLAYMISEKIVRREIKKETIITDVIKESLNKIVGANNIQVKLNPNELEQIKMESGSTFAGKSLSSINFEADERIDEGGCLVITEIGNVDGRIPSQMEEIQKQLNAAYSVEEE
jgi:flagellar biosynthesis/type III secretory pathway protein FliH